MSAGICIMNKNAIALAADSAVTIGPHLAIHNSANKLFALSKVAPVGAIIYSNAEVMGIPVEILIKQYKRDLGQKAFDFLEEYVNDFISYLLCNKQLWFVASFRRCYAMSQDLIIEGIQQNGPFPLHTVYPKFGHIRHNDLQRRRYIPAASNFVRKLNAFLSGRLIPVFSGFRA